MKMLLSVKLYNYLIEAFLISINLAIYLNNMFTNLVEFAFINLADFKSLGIKWKLLKCEEINN